MTRPKLISYFIFALVLTFGSIAFASSSTTNQVLKYSKYSDRGSKQLLNASVVSGNIYVVVPSNNVSKVQFSLDNVSGRLDTSAPFDLIGSNRSSALALNTKNLLDGTHSISAVVTFSSGSTKTIRSTFTVKNNSSPTPITSTTTTTATTTTTKPIVTTTSKPVTTTTLPPTSSTLNQIAGVTIDNPWNTSNVVSSLDQLKAQSGKTITARIVFDSPSDGVTANDYAQILPTISAKHAIMGELLDSFNLKSMSVADYQARTSEYFSKLKTEVDIWEIGNEANGSWVGDPNATAQKIDASYSVIANQAPTALTLHCDRTKDDMFEFSNRLSASTRSGIDYIFVSQYDADCIYTGTQYGSDATDSKGRFTAVQWASQFARLQALYPNAKLGFGEVGIAEPLRASSSDATEAEFISYYYGLGISIAPLVSGATGKDVYVGGYFYWYYSSDMVPFNKNVVLTNQIVNSIKAL